MIFCCSVDPFRLLIVDEFELSLLQLLYDVACVLLLEELQDDVESVVHESGQHLFLDCCVSEHGRVGVDLEKVGT